MPLIPIQTPFTANELTQKINDNNTYLDSAKANVTDLANYIPTSSIGQPNGIPALDASGNVIQNAITATTANNYNASTGTIQSALSNVNSSITSITTGSTPVGYARELAPLTPPGNDMLYGTSSSGVVGWFPIPQPPDGIAGPAPEPFTTSDPRWGGPVNGIYTLTFEHNGKFPFGVYQQAGSVYSLVNVDVQRDNTNISIKAMNQFTGYVVVM